MEFAIGDIGRFFNVTIRIAKGRATQDYYGEAGAIDKVRLMFVGVNPQNKIHHYIFKISDGLWSAKYSISQDTKTLYRCGYCKAGEIIEITRE